MDTNNEDHLTESLGSIHLDNASSKPYRIEVSDVMGRYLVANKNLKAGELIIKEQPIIVGPVAESEPVCLGCYYPVPKCQKKQYKCPHCGWALCSPKCRGIKKFSGHSAHECTVLREHRVADHFINISEKEVGYMYESLLVLRCLLLKVYRRDVWDKLFKMESHNEIRKAIPQLWSRNQNVIVSRIRDKWNFNEFEEELVHSVCGILEVNSFEVGSNGVKARALFPEAFYIAHNCSPNTTHTDDKDYVMYVRMTKDVAEGDMISLNYSYTLMGTLKRREHLKDSKFFMCFCNRCSDPTELGTYASALVCPKCSGGCILSTNPLNQDADWKCRKCGHIITGKHVLALVNKLFDEMETIDQSEGEGLEEFLLKYRNVLHKNHYLSLSTKHQLSTQVYGRTENHMLHLMSEAELKRKEDYCRDLLNVIDVLEPGLSRLRGIIMYELHAPIMLQTNRLFEMKRITNAELKKRLKEVIKLLKESETILSFEPEGTQEYEMSAAAKEALAKMVGYI